MTSETFCLRYAYIMEQYQFIEEFLERLYAVISDKPYVKGLQDVDKAPLPTIIKAIHKLEKEQNITVFTIDEYEELSQVILRRNFWSHECFTKLIFAKNSALKKPEDRLQMEQDIRQAEEWREKIFQKQLNY